MGNYGCSTYGQTWEESTAGATASAADSLKMIEAQQAKIVDLLHAILEELRHWERNR